MANTVLLSQASGNNKLQLVVPQQLQGSSAGVGFTVQCFAPDSQVGDETFAAYGFVDWSSWSNVRGTVQTVSGNPKYP